MKIRNILAGAALAFALSCPAQQINPITRAMLDGYGEILRENPNDYFTLYQRGAQFYQLSRYDEALNDIAKALACTPAKDTGMLAQEYSLMADINIELKEYDKALTNVNKALEINPQNYADLYKKGNICLYLKRPEEAYSAFNSLLRLKTRSQEAFFGMARADIQMGKTEDARELMKQAQDADPSNYVTFCRLGDLKRELGDNEAAAADYLSAFSLADDPSRPLESLISLAFDNYKAFDTAITYALSLTDNRAPLYFLKGNIALASGNYEEARSALGELLSMPEGREGDVYAQMARACLALDKLGEAQTNIDLSLIKSPSAANYVTKSEIELASGNPAAAALSARKALLADPQSTDAMIASALAAAAQGEGREALRALNEAVMNDPGDLYLLMLRAWVNANVLNDNKAAVADYARVASAQADAMPDAAWKALAQSRSGKKLDADTTVERAINEDSSKDDLFYAAIYYAQSGNLDKASAMLDRAKAKGFANIHKLKSDNTADLNIAPIRHLN